MSALFISHSSKDNAIAAELTERLSQQGHRSLFLDFDPEHGIPTGRNWEQELYHQLRMCQAVLVLCSSHSTTSPWVFAEITHAKALGKHVFPIKIEACTIPSLLTERQILDLTIESEGAYQQLWRGLKVAGLDPTNSFDWDESRPPYPGLLAFQEADAAIFFARDKEIEEGLDLLRQLHRFGGPRMIIVLGASGSGKSSFVRAGLVPHLRKSDEWFILDPFRPQEHPEGPFKGLSLVLAHACRRHGLSQSSEEIQRTLEHATQKAPEDGAAYLNGLLRSLCQRAGQPNATVLFVIDQLEEMLHAPDLPKAQRFALLLQASVEDPQSPVMMLCTLRSDFLGKFQQDRTTKEFRFSDLLLNPMPPERFGEIIERPAEKIGLHLAPGLTTEMVQDTKTDDALPLLAFTLRKLYEQYGTDGRLDIEDYRAKLGGLAGSVAKAANTVFTARPLSPEGQAALRRAFLKLVRVNEEGQPVRQIARWKDLPAAAHEVLERFLQARLLVARSQGAEHIVEVAHEVIFRAWGQLNQWLDEDREFLLWRRRLQISLTEWELKSRDSTLLLQGGRLTEAQQWLEQRKADLDDPERVFIETSVQGVATQRRLRRTVITGVLVLILALAAYGTYTNWQAQAQAERAQASALITVATSALSSSTEPMVAPLLIRESTQFPEPDGGLRVAHQAASLVMPIAILQGHTGPVGSAAFSPDGQRVVTASWDKTVRVWRTDGTGAPVLLQGHTAIVMSAAFSPDGQRVVTASDDKTARVWRADGTGEPVLLQGHTAIVMSAAFSPDGQRVVTASADKTVRVWRADGIGEPVLLQGHTAIVMSAAFSPDGQRVVTASWDKTVRVWRADGTGEPVLLRGHTASVWSAAFSPDGQRVVTASNDKTVRVWQADGTGEPVLLQGHTARVASAAFSPDGQRVVTASDDKTVRVWRADGTGEPVLLQGHTASVASAAFSPDGQRVVTASDDKTARVWRADGTGEPVLLQGHTAIVVSAAFSPDGQRVVTVSDDKTARVWRADGTGEPVLLQGHTASVWSAAFSPDGQRVVTASEDKTVRVWRADGTGEPVLLQGHTASVWSAAFSPDGQRVVTASDDKTARVWRADGTGEPVLLQGHTASVWSAAFSPDGQRMVTASADKTARVWRADGTGAPVLLQGHTARVVSAAFSPDGQRVVTASEDKTARVWRADGTGAPVLLQGHTARVVSAAFSPDGQRVVTASEDKTARVWRADGTGAPVLLQGHTARVRSAAFSPDGQRVVTASEDKTARVWRADGTGAPVLLQGHTNRVQSAAFSPDGQRIVTASWDKTVRVWRADGTGEPVLLQGHTGDVVSAAFSPDGQRIVTASWDKTVRVWRVNWTGLGAYLWEFTTVCLTTAQRRQLLGESYSTAHALYETCERRYARVPLP